MSRWAAQPRWVPSHPWQAMDLPMAFPRVTSFGAGLMLAIRVAILVARWTRHRAVARCRSQPQSGAPPEGSVPRPHTGRNVPAVLRPQSGARYLRERMDLARPIRRASERQSWKAFAGWGRTAHLDSNGPLLSRVAEVGLGVKPDPRFTRGGAEHASQCRSGKDTTKCAADYWQRGERKREGIGVSVQVLVANSPRATNVSGRVANRVTAMGPPKS
jgi:hypothetical protein